MKKSLALLGIALTLALSGCGNGNDEKTGANNPQDNQPNMEHSNKEHSNMEHSTSGELPKDLKEAKAPTYKVGSQATIKADHMEGMNGAKATIVGAFDTTVYTVSYTPTTGGQTVNNHKWVIHEELKDAGKEPLKPGTEVMLEADHMPGMKGAKAKIDSAERTTVYMVDYTPTTGGEPVKNHKWVTESELSAQ